MSTATAAPPEPDILGGPEVEQLGEGWHHGLPMKDYLALPAMSSSQIELLRRSPVHWKHERDNPREYTSRAMEVGTAVHIALLEPESFKDEVLRKESCGEKLKSGARKGEACGSTARSLGPDGYWVCGSHGGGDPPPGALSADEYDAVLGMRDAVLAHPRARTFFQGETEREVTGLWRDPETGIWCRMRADIRVPRAPIVVDLKSCRDARDFVFRKEASDRGYHRKLAWYRRGERAMGREVDDCAIIAVENEPPHGVRVFLLRPEDIEAAEGQINRAMNRLAYCLEEDRWPGYGDEFSDLEILPYATA